ncbi:MarR family winged helix-turn-helix transcriptional regulator [Nocardia africana]|uniref:MarR family n=1 Tax=Nocardia africana TaxID=134964 RepID=A0A378WNU5_9NOCA|nr:MarR family transcriptional regulator [Nocardia africana]MCC3314718.1 MarR family transcriptional regulator [Nocardia africana]SUA43000.1 MarR family [Nocardia africana]
MNQPLVALLRGISAAIVSELVTTLHAAGYPDITAAHHPVFYNMDAGGTRLTTLAARAGITHQSMGELVAGLIDLGYLARQPDPSDRRARLIVLTEKGTRAVRVARAAVSDIDRAWYARLEAAGIQGDLRTALSAALREAQQNSQTTVSSAEYRDRRADK